MKIIFYCVGEDVSSGEKNRIMLHEDTVIFFICSQCVFTTAARRVDNKFILNTKGKWCGAAQSLLRQLYITILWVSTFMAETGEACIITRCHDEGSIRKEAQIWSSHWYGEICVSTHCRTEILIKLNIFWFPSNPFRDSSSSAFSTKKQRKLRSNHDTAQLSVWITTQHWHLVVAREPAPESSDPQSWGPWWPNNVNMNLYLFKHFQSSNNYLKYCKV